MEKACNNKHSQQNIQPLAMADTTARKSKYNRSQWQIQPFA